MSKNHCSFQWNEIVESYHVICLKQMLFIYFLVLNAAGYLDYQRSEQQNKSVMAYFFQERFSLKVWLPMNTAVHHEDTHSSRSQWALWPLRRYIVSCWVVSLVHFLLAYCYARKSTFLHSGSVYSYKSPSKCSFVLSSSLVTL